jgi:uncharacterized membrane protein YkvA (DUF1232 family)
MLKQRLNLLFKPYKAQFDRCPIHIKIIAILCVMYLSVPIDPFDILFPWMAFTDDLFIAGVLIKILHKHGGLPEEDRTTPIDLLRDIFKRTDKKQEDTSLAVHLFKDNVCSQCGLKSTK